MTKNIIIIGSGAWGTALAKHCFKLGGNVTILCRRNTIAKSINNLGKNENLKNIDLKGIKATTNKSITKLADIIFLVVPSQNIRKTLQTIIIKNNTPVIICSKGIELISLKLLTKVVKECLKKADIMVLSGPTFAIEVAKGFPTSITLATKNLNSINTLNVINSIKSNYFRIYKTNDLIGCEISGAVKNVIAIACGITVGKNLGDNAKSALITRAIFEINKLSKALGGHYKTIFEMCSLGDLILTCSSHQSRNMSFGILLGQNKTVNEILNSQKTVVEGVLNSKSIYHLATKLNIEMPICKLVYNVIHKKKDIDLEIKNLLNRSQQ